jgi:hypothetical protein
MYPTITPSALSAASPGILSPKSSLRFWKNFLVSSMLLFATLLPNLSKAQTALTIGTGTTTSSYYPIYTFYGYNYSQSTYLASEIVAAGATAGTPGYISSISYNLATYYAFSLCKDWVVYMGNTSKSTFSGTTDWVALSGLTKVFDGVVTPTGTGWFKITFPTPFYWDGTSNLVVAVDENTPSYTSTMPWYTTTRTGTRSISYYSDGTNPDPASPPAANTTYAGTPNIKIDYTPATPCSGTTVGGTAVASATSLCPGNTVALSTTGATVGTGLTWQWESAPAAAGPWTAIAGATSMSLTIAPPSGTTTYYRRKTTCTSTSSSAYSTGVAVSVSTSISLPYSENFETATTGVNVPCAAVTGVWDGAWASYYGYNWTLMGSTTAGYTGSSRPGGSKYIQTGYYIGTYAGYTAEYWFTPGINLSTGKTYRFSYWYRAADYMVSYYPAGCQFGMYYNTAQTKASGLVAIKPDLPAEANGTYKQNSGDFSVPATGVYHLAVKVDNKGYAYYGGGCFDDLNLIELPACNTATAATFGSGGKASASPNVMCTLPGTTTLSVTGTPPFSGLSFEWEMAAGSTAGFATPTIVGSAASVSTTITAGGTYFFRCKVTCAATGLTSYSDTTKVMTTPITPPYVEDFEGSTPGTNVPCANYTYSWGDYYWWTRSGVHPYCTGITNHTPGGSKYLHAGLYLGAVSSGSDEYWFTPGLALTAGKAYDVSFWFSNAAYSTGYSTIATKIGVRAGTAQTKAAMTITAGFDTTHYLNAVMTPTYNKLNRGFISPTTGTYYVGISVNHAGYSYYGMAIDDIGITQMPPCSAKPTAGAAVATPSLICTTGSTVLSIPGVSVASDLTFQWQERIAGVWTDILGATAPSYTTPVITAGPVYFRCYVSCPSFGADTSAPVTVSVGALDLPYTETFESGTVGVNMPCAAVGGTWSAGSLLYWDLRSGDYSSSYPGIKNRTPGGSKYIYCGYYNGPYYSTGDNFFWFTPALKMTAGKGYKVSFWYNGSGYSVGYNGMKIGIYAGTAQNAAGMILRAGGIDSAVKGEASTYAQFSRSFVAATTANHYVGIKMYHTGYDYPGGVIDDIGIEQLPDCAGKPVAGSPDGVPYMLCASGTTRLRLSGTSVASAIQYQWQEATSPTGPWTNSTAGTGATTGSYLTGTLTTTTWFRCIVTCATSGLTDTSSVLTMNVGAITPPYKEDFERGTVGTNLPCAAVSGTWTTASTYVYWTLKGSAVSSAYPVNNTTPGGSQYLFAGYYAGTYYSPSLVYYWFTPAIRFTAGATYEFSYWYLGSGYSGGSTNLGMYYGTTQTAAGMTTAIRPDLVGQNTGVKKQIVGRFVAPSTANYYIGIKVNHTTYTYSGMAIDDIGLEQLPPCTGAPTVGTVTSAPSMLCTPGGTVALNMDLAGVSRVAGLVYDWYVSTSGPTGPWTRMTATSLTSPAYTTGSTITTSWYRASVKCAATGDSTLSSVVKVDVGAVTPPYIETFETVTPGTNAPCASYTYSWGAGAYWFTYGTPFSTSYPAIDNHTIGGSRYLFAGYYLGTYYSGAKQYWFTPAIAFTAGKLYQFNFWYNGSGYAGGNTNIEAFYGTAQNAASMTTAIGTGITGVNTTKYKEYKQRFTPTATGNFYIGIAVNHTTYAYPGIVLDDIGLQEVPPCSAPVVAGSIFADPTHVCTPGGTTTLDLLGSTLATGLTYDWLSSTTSAAGPYTSTGGSTVPYNTDPLFGPTWFKCVVKCSATGAVDTSAAFRMGVGGFDLPYSENFESTSVGTAPLCSDATTWGTYYYNGWHVYGSLLTGPYVNRTPGGKNYLIGGYYLGSPSMPSEDNYWFTPGLNLRSGYKYNLSFYYLATYNVAYTCKMGVYVGRTQTVGGMSTNLVKYRQFSNTSYELMDTNFTVPTTAVYYIGFRKSGSNPSSTYDYYGLALDDININYAPCAGTPFAGSITSSKPSGTAYCKYTPITLTDVGATISLVPGIKYQWYRRITGSTGAWTVVVGAKDTVLKADSLIGYDYRMAVVCSNTNDTVYTSPFEVPALPAHPTVTITPSITPVNYCLGDSVRFSATSFTGAVYDWMIDSVVVPGWKFSDFGGTEPGTIMVRVSSPLSPCPAWSNKVTLVVNDPGYSVTITKPSDSIICAGTSMLLNATSSKTGVTYQWRRDNVDIPGATGASLLVTTGGYYRVMAYDGLSICKAASRNIMITVKPNPPAVISIPGGTATACENEGVLLKANVGGFSYEWTRAGSTIFGWRDSSQLVKNSGVYAVKVRSKDGCVSVSSSVTVNILPSPTPVITKTGLVLSVTTPTYISYQWILNGKDILGATGPTHNLVFKGVYKLRVKDANGCIGESNPIEVSDPSLQDPTSINTVTLQKDQIKIYPNPTDSKVFIESPISVMITVKDVRGKTIIESQETKEIDLSKFADGVYLFMVSDKEGKELVKQQRVSKITRK